jgi:hypothetical protein
MTTTTGPLVRDQATAAPGRWLMLIVLLAGRQRAARGPDLRAVRTGVRGVRVLLAAATGVLAPPAGPAGLPGGGGGYLAVASVLRSGAAGGVLLQVGLIVTGAALAQ